MGLLDFIKSLFSNGKKNVKFVGLDLIKIYKSKEPFEVALFNGNEPLSDKRVTIKVNGVSYERVTDKDGIAKLNINLGVGDYRVYVSFDGDDEYNSVNSYYNLYVNPNIMICNDLNMNYRDGSRFKCKLLDLNNEPISNAVVTFNVNNVEYERVTDNDGVAGLNINLDVGEYTIESRVNNVHMINKIKVNPAPTPAPEPKSNGYFGYWVFGKDMYNVNIQDLKSDGVTEIFLNYYAFKLYGEEKVKKWISDVSPIRVHVWMQCFYDGEWHNPKTYNLNSKVLEAKYYSEVDGVDGVHLDYLRYPGNAYKTDGGSEAILDFVRKVKNNLHGEVLLSCAVMPENESKKYYGQDIGELGKICNMVIPMQYKGNYRAGTEWLKKTTQELSSKCTIWSGLQSYRSDDDSTILPVNELENDITTCMSNGAKGVLLFRYGLSPRMNFKK